MSANAFERDAVESIALALRASGSNGWINPPHVVVRYLAQLAERHGRPIASVEFSRLAHDAFRHLSATPAAPTVLRGLDIFMRCDVERQPHKQVAAAVSLSRSQFYRDLRAARIALARFIERPAARHVAATTVLTFDPFDLALSNARALEQGGDWSAAATILARLADELTDADRRVGVEVRLARVYIEVQQYLAAQERLALARRLTLIEARHVQPPLTARQMAEIDVTQARLAEALGASDQADELAAKSCATLHSSIRESNSPRALSALVDALTLRAEVWLGRGEFERARRDADEAASLAASFGGVDAPCEVGFRCAGAMASLLAGRDPEDTLRELHAAFELALRCGLTREAIVVVTHRAGSLRLMHRARDEVALLTPLLPLARVVGAGGVLAAFLSELIAANVECGAHADAVRYARELRECAQGNVHMQAVNDFTSAKIALAACDYRSALSMSSTALAGFSRIGKPRLTGSIRLLQSKAFIGMGQRPHAERALREAIEHLTGHSHPSRLAEAYDLLGEVSGHSEHRARARSIRRSTPIQARNER